MTKKRHEPISEHDVGVARAMRKKSRRSFLVMGIGAAAGFAGWKWLATRPEGGDMARPLRRTLEFNEKLAKSYFNGTRAAPTFPREMAREPRLTGEEGLPAAFDPLTWRLHVTGAGQARTVALEDIKRLPRVNMTTEHKCIEGWSEIVNWTGARLSDFAAAYKLGTRDGTSPDIRDRPDHLHRRAPARLLGRAGLRLVRRTVTRAAERDKNRSESGLRASRCYGPRSLARARALTACTGPEPSPPR